MTDLENLKRELDLPSDPETDRVLAALADDTGTLNPLKRDAIRASLLTHAAHPTPMQTARPFLWFLPLGALAALVIFLSAGKGPPSVAPTQTGRQVAVAERNGFGALPALSPAAAPAPAAGDALALAAPAAPAGAPAAKSLETGTAGPALAAESADVGLAAPAAGGVAVSSRAIAVPAPSPVRCLECGKYLPPRVIYAFTGTMPAIPAEVPVFRLRPTAVPGDAALAILRSLGLGGFGGVTVQNLSFTEAGDDPLTWTFDGNGGALSFWRQGAVIAYAEGGATAGVSADVVTLEKRFPAPPPPDLEPRASDISDADALAIARDFLTKHGVDASRYGAPSVTRQDYDYPCKGGPCPLLMESSGTAAKDAAVQTAPAPSVGVAAPTSVARPEIYPPPYWQNPYVVVTYPALREGAPVLAWDGSPQPGITLSMNQATRRPDNGVILLPLDADRSLYPARDADEIRKDALRGGLNPYWTDGGIYPPEEEKKRPVVKITLTAATFGYVEKYAEDGRTRYLLPVVGFRGTQKDQYGNLSDWGTVVPVVRSGTDQAADAGVTAR